MTDISKIQRARFYMNKKQKHLRTAFYIQHPNTLQKSGQFALCFYIQNSWHFTLRDFSWNFWSWNLYTKSWHFALRDVFIYKKPDTSKKARQFVIRFYIKKSGHFALRNFSLNFWDWDRGEGISIGKKKSLCVTFLNAKNNALFVTFLYAKIKTLCITFLYARTNALRVRFLYLKFII